MLLRELKDVTNRRWFRWTRDAVILLALFLGAREGLARLRAPGLAIAAPAPRTVGKTLDGATLDVASFRGRPVLVNLWATWCGPCRSELPDLAAAARAHPEVQFVGLATSSSDREAARVLVRDAGVGYPVALLDARTEAQWHASVVPSSVLLDREGRVVWRRSGTIDVDDVERALSHLGRAD